MQKITVTIECLDDATQETNKVTYEMDPRSFNFKDTCNIVRTHFELVLEKVHTIELKGYVKKSYSSKKDNGA